MLGRSAIHAIRAVLELADAPLHWRSVRDLAASQQLPEALLEQLMLRLRRAGLLEARRGRQGGYRLARPAGAIPLAAILDAVAVSGAWPSAAQAIASPPTGDASPASPDAALLVTVALERRLQQALERELARCTLEELHHDLRSARAALSEDGGMLLG